MISVDPRQLCQIEIPVSDLKRALAFYAEVFGWQPVPAELHEFVVMTVPDGCPFGISLIPGRPTGPAVGNALLYFAVDDPEAVASAGERAGGRRASPPVTLASYGQVHQIEDSEGNRFGLYRPRLARA